MPPRWADLGSLVNLVMFAVKSFLNEPFCYPTSWYPYIPESLNAYRKCRRIHICARSFMKVRIMEFLVRCTLKDTCFIFIFFWSCSTSVTNHPVYPSCLEVPSSAFISKPSHSGVIFKTRLMYSFRSLSIRHALKEKRRILKMPSANQ